MNRSNEDRELESFQPKPSIQNEVQRSWIDSTLRTKLCSAPALLLVIFLMSMIPVAKLIIGIIHYGDCPIRSSIATYMITCALVEIIIALLTVPGCLLAENTIRKRNHTETCCEGCCTMLFASCFACFILMCMVILYLMIMLTLMIIGSIIIFPVKRSVQFSNSNTPLYCHPTLYNFAFWTLIVYYVILALFLTITLSFYLYLRLNGRMK